MVKRFAARRASTRSPRARELRRPPPTRQNEPLRERLPRRRSGAPIKRASMSRSKAARVSAEWLSTHGPLYRELSSAVYDAKGSPCARGYKGRGPPVFLDRVLSDETPASRPAPPQRTSHLRRSEIRPRRAESPCSRRTAEPPSRPKPDRRSPDKRSASAAGRQSWGPS